MEENFYEFLSLGLAVAIGITGVLAFIYKRGQTSGIDSACGKRIEDKLDTMKEEGDEIHNELKKGLQQVSADVNKLTGAFETFQQMVNKT